MTLGADWTDFFIAAAGAAAALAGLIFVSLSVNIAQILKFEHLPDRALATLASLVLILVTSLAALIPQARLWFAVEAAAFAAVVWWLQLRSGQIALRAGRGYGRSALESANELITGQIQTLPFLIGAGLLLAGRDDGLYGVAFGTLAIFILSVVNAWVLLVEILR